MSKKKQKKAKKDTVKQKQKKSNLSSKKVPMMPGGYRNTEYDISD